MALDTIGEVFGGPGRWETLLGSLWEGKQVYFELVKWMRLVIGGTAVEAFPARVAGMQRADGGKSSGPTDQWLIKGEVLALSGSGQPVGLRFSGKFNTFSRGGEFLFTEREYEGGDAIEGLDGSGKPIPLKKSLITA